MIAKEIKKGVYKIGPIKRESKKEILNRLFTKIGMCSSYSSHYENNYLIVDTEESFYK